MQVWVINLEDAPERLAHMRQQLDGLGIGFQRLHAIDRSAAPHHPAFPRIPDRNDRDWSSGEIGCLLSHFSAWQNIATGDEVISAVMEDDVLLSPGATDILNGNVKLPKDAELIRLETSLQRVRVERRPAYGAPLFHRLRGHHSGTGAYLLTRDTARALIKQLEDFDTPADVALFSPEHPVGRKLRVYQAVPAVAVQGSVLSKHPADHLKSGLDSERASLPTFKHAETWAKGSAAELLPRFARHLHRQLSSVKVVVPFDGPRLLQPEP